MAKSTVVPFELPSEFSPDPLTEVIQTGARELLRTAVQAYAPSPPHWDFACERDSRRIQLTFPAS